MASVFVDLIQRIACARAWLGHPAAMVELVSDIAVGPIFDSNTAASHRVAHGNRPKRASDAHS
jgi:hypothetical protein